MIEVQAMKITLHNDKIIMYDLKNINLNFVGLQLKANLISPIHPCKPLCFVAFIG